MTFLLYSIGLLLVSFAMLCLITPGVFRDRRNSKKDKFLVLFLGVACFAFILTVVALLAPNVGEGHPDTSLIEEGRYQIVAVEQTDDGKVELLLSDGEHGSRYYKLSMKKLGLEKASEELEGQWLVVEKLKGYDYKIVPGK